MIEDTMFTLSVPLDENYSADYQISITTPKITSPDISEREEKIIAIMKENPDITAVQIASELGVSSRTIENSIKKLREKKYIERQGATKDGRWIVIK